jgi:hypothetical protein
MENVVKNIPDDGGGCFDFGCDLLFAQVRGKPVQVAIEAVSATIDQSDIRGSEPIITVGLRFLLLALPQFLKEPQQDQPLLF